MQTPGNNLSGFGDLTNKIYTKHTPYGINLETQIYNLFAERYSTENKIMEERNFIR